MTFKDLDQLFAFPLYMYLYLGRFDLVLDELQFQ